MLCKCCESISLNFHRSRLLAKEYTSVAGGLPSPILEPLRIEHQPNLHALQRSAEAGCELCSLFVNFIECKERQPWEGSLISHLPFLVTYRYTPCYGSDYVKSDHRHGVHGFSLRQDVQSNSGRCEWPMTLFTNKEDIAAREEGEIIKRYIDTNPASDEAYELVRTWISECSFQHTKCRQVLGGRFPTRIIYVGQKDLFLETCMLTSNGPSPRYAAFSHVWGGGSPLKTTKATFEQHQRSIPFGKLPQSFQDAVHVTRRLGIQYLWIDALCIIQDSIEDWEIECAKMADIFRNSYITIAAPDALNTDAGFLHKRHIPSVSLPYLGLKGEPSGYMSARPQELINELHYSNDVPLNTRAWAFQEKLLSRRTLYYGNRQIYYECDTAAHHESSGTYDTRRGGLRVRDNLLRADYDASVWYWVVEDYCGRLLTLPQDQLPALSGLASEFQRKTGFHYLAGLWQEDLIRGLAWEISEAVDTRWAPKPQVYCGPSWSWASVDGTVWYERTRELDVEADMINADVMLAGLDQLGRVSSGSLTLSGRLKMAVATSPPSDSSVPRREQGGSKAWKLFDPSAVNKEIGRCIFDSNDPILQSQSAAERTIWCFCLGHWKTSPHDYVRTSVALALKPVKAIQPTGVPKAQQLTTTHSPLAPEPFLQYERVGSLRICIDLPSRKKLSHASIDSGPGWFEGCEKTAVTII